MGRKGPGKMAPPVTVVLASFSDSSLALRMTASKEPEFGITVFHENWAEVSNSKMIRKRPADIINPCPIFLR
jgi:hypothetical protein